VTVKILIVDDEPAVEDLLKSNLKKYLDDYLLLSALNGAEAIQLIEKMHEENSIPDFTLMDLKMPVLDGIECTKKLVEMGIQNIFILTAFIEPGLISRAVAAGAKGIIKKREGYQAIAKKIADMVRALRSTTEQS
jgi:CheY-like chemotaxis protein